MATVGCGDDGGATAQEDAAVVARAGGAGGVDSGEAPDAARPTDAGPTTRDASANDAALVDAGVRGGLTDAGLDAGRSLDAGHDAGAAPEPDGGPGGGEITDPGPGETCGTMTCAPGERCFSSMGLSCSIAEEDGRCPEHYVHDDEGLCSTSGGPPLPCVFVPCSDVPRGHFCAVAPPGECHDTTQPCSPCGSTCNGIDFPDFFDSIICQSTIAVP